MKTKSLVLTALVLMCVIILGACFQTVQTYNITFVDHDGSVLLELTLDEGTMPEYTLENPTREATAQYSYEFIGWDKVIEPATENVTYKAMYNETVNKYLVTFVDENGDVLEEREFEYGKTPSYSGETPTKDNTAENTYSFAGWDKEIVAVTEDVTYTATYSSEKNKYRIIYD